MKQKNSETSTHRIFALLLALVMLTVSLPISSIFAQNSNIFLYTMFASSSEDKAITFNSQNVCLNGNIATNGTIYSTGNMNVNGSRFEHVNEEMILILQRIQSSYFSGAVFLFMTVITPARIRI